MSIRAAVLLFLSLSTSACTMHAVAGDAKPNVIAKKKLAGVPKPLVTGIGNEPYCSRTPGLKDFCVTQLEDSLFDGLERVMTDFSTGQGEPFRAKFTFLSLSHAYASGGAPEERPVRLSMKWQLVVEDPKGVPVLQLAETTEGRNVLLNVNQASQLTTELVERVLETVGERLNALP